MRLFDYLYLDSSKLSDYMTALDPGVIRELRETVKVQSAEEDEKEEFLNQPPTIESATKESMHERILSASEKHSFNRLYEALKGNVSEFDEFTEIELGDVHKNDLIEVTREFAPSPLSQMIDSMIEFTSMAQQMGVTEVDEEAQTAIHGITMLFRGNEENQKEVPVISSADDFRTSVFFMARRQYILRGVEELEGESTLFGKVEKIVPPGKEVDLFDMLKILPRSMRRSKAGDDLVQNLKEAFRSWPQELGGPIAEDAFSLPGPLVVVSPLAVFR